MQCPVDPGMLINMPSIHRLQRHYENNRQTCLTAGEWEAISPT